MRLSRDPAARRRLAALVVAAALALAAGLAAGAGDQRDRGAGSEGGDPSGAGGRDGGSGAGRAAAALPLERQVGQLLVSSFEGPSAPPYLLRRLRAGQTAGVILFGANAPDAASLRRLTGSLQRAAGGGALVMADQEGGPIRSVPFAAPRAGQAAQGDPAAVRAAMARAGRELRALGVNVNLAPVAEVPASPGAALAGRSYPGDARAVAARTAAAVRGSLAARVAPTVKHFPGLGAAMANTDDASVTIDATRERLRAADLVPFRAAVAARTPLVMASHALYPAVDPDRIASQSPALLDRLLRGELGYRGAVVTDSLEAQAVLDRSGVAAAALRSVGAGADLILMTGSGSWNEVYPALLRQARRSPRFRRAVARSVARVTALKRRLALAPPRSR